MPILSLFFMAISAHSSLPEPEFPRAGEAPMFAPKAAATEAAPLFGAAPGGPGLDGASRGAGLPPEDAAMTDASMFAGAVEELGDEVLAEQRGGFSIGGLDVTLGAQIETFIDGQLSLVTTVNWTDTAATTTRTVSGLLTPASAAELQAGLLNTGQISMNVGDASVFLAHGGRTAVLHNVDSGLQSVLINTANNTSIRTQVTAAVDLGGYSGFRDDMRIGALAASLGQAIGAATSGSVMN
jgi:hypothetical protein